MVGSVLLIFVVVCVVFCLHSVTFSQVLSFLEIAIFSFAILTIITSRASLLTPVIKIAPFQQLSITACNVIINYNTLFHSWLVLIIWCKMLFCFLSFSLWVCLNIEEYPRNASCALDKISTFLFRLIHLLVIVQTQGLPVVQLISMVHCKVYTKSDNKPV
jgi:hypothetical protein